MPVHFDSTDFLLHPIGQFVLYEGRNKVYSGSAGMSGFSVAYTNKDELSGDLHNVKFQKLGTADWITLTTEDIRISSIIFLRTIYEKTGRQYLLYSVNEDSNQDGQFDKRDATVLYLSNIDGSGFERVSPEGYQLFGHKAMPINNRLYFKAVEDVDGNATFNEADQLHYYYLDFTTDQPKVTNYNPLTL